MLEFRSSYILTRSETLTVLRFFMDKEATLPGQYIRDEYLADCNLTQNEIEGLVYKGLAHKKTREIIIEPVLGFLAESILSAKRIWIIKYLEQEEIVLITRSQGFYLLITNYELIAEAIKITPFPNISELRKDFKMISSVKQILTISEDGRLHRIVPDNNFKWLEEEQYDNNIY